jgi:uncharacterized protein (TIGR02271 family)
MRWSPNEVRAGMTVTSTKGERLGNVVRCGADTFVVEKGVFFPKDYELRYDHITALNGEQIAYSLSDADSRFASVAETARGGMVGSAATTAAAARAATAPARAVAPASASTSRQQEMRIPLMEEEIGIEKVSRETGHVRIHKTVKTEEKHFIVPVTREDVVIERVSASGDEEASELAFQEQTVDLPLHEEDLRVTKRSHVREEVVVHPIVQAMEKEASASLRHEEAEIEDTRGPRARGLEGTPTRPGGYGAPGGR